MRNERKKKARKQTARKARIGNVRVELTFDNRYRQSDGRYAVVIRIYHERKYLYLSTGWAMTPDEFDCMDARTEAALSSRFDRVCEKVTESVNNGTFCLQSFRAPEDGTSDGTLAGLMEEKAKLCKTVGTATNYRNGAKLLREFRADGLPLRAVGTVTIGEYDEWMAGKGYAAATRNINLTLVKASINYGTYKGYIKESQYPFKRNAHEIDKVAVPKSAKRDTNWLTADEMGRLHDYFTQTHDWGAGVFLFSYLCGGVNLADLIDLRYDEYYFDESAFRFVRKKIATRTGQTTVIPVCDRMREVMAGLGAVEVIGGSPVPRVAGRDKGTVSSVLNSRLKTVAKKVGITKNISINTSRHTFATLAVKSGMPLSLVEQAMSHAPAGVLSHYVGAWTPDEMRPYFEKLL
ncbi:MAG: tyrosine-type recombinase/integrase [Bacteroidales bacterium]|nr:tyrosine-type recombinase/integrase [Bacteroidales bacterium]MBR4637026.1 tyrosine-type recombinase/integrase [Bacteroidales bacterium]